ncbi:MAG: HIT domain-containing protein [Candidatus Aminicenantes bacterium]
MEYIAAVWRADYVRNSGKMKECIFCRALKSNHDRDAYILHRGRFNFIILNKFPYSPGHLMIAPLQHLDSIEKADKTVSDEMSDFLKISLKILRDSYKPHGFNTGMNLGQSAGAGVAGHYHLHIIPRWTGDSNFMPIIGKTRVTIEDLDTSFQRLAPLFQKIRKNQNIPGKQFKSS